MIRCLRSLRCALKGHRLCVYLPALKLWTCRCEKARQTDLEWIQEVMSS